MRAERPFEEEGAPWYRLRPGIAVAVAAGLFVAVSILQWFNDGNGQAIVVLYTLPIALLAVTMGQRGGLAGAATGFVLFSFFEIVHSSGDIEVTGWVVRATAMFVLGVLLGRATDQTLASERTALDQERRRCELEEANSRYAEAVEINDSIIQELVAAKWMVELGQSDKAADVLTATIVRGEHMVSKLLPRRELVPADNRQKLDR